MHSVLGSLQDLPYLSQAKDISQTAHENGRLRHRNPRGDRGGSEIDTFITRIEGPDILDNRKPCLYSMDVDKTLDDAFKDLATWPEDTTNWSIKDMDEYSSTMASGILKLNANRSTTSLIQHHELSPPVVGTSLAVDYLHTNSWEYMYPSYQRSTGYMKIPSDNFFNITVDHEMTIGKPETLKQFVEYIGEAKAISDEKYGPSALAFKVLYTMVDKNDYKTIVEHRQNSFWDDTPDVKSFTFPIAKEAVALKMVPVKILFGTGNDWLGSLKIGITRDNTSFKLELGQTPQQELDFITSLGTLVGFNALKDMKLLKEFFEDFYPKARFNPPPVLDLATLATAAGYGLESVSPTSLCFNITGAMYTDLPVRYPALDHVETLDDLPKARIEYIKWTLYQISSVYAILMGTLIRNLFPDPEIVCDLLEARQKPAYVWISEMISQALANSKRHKEAAMMATSRQELMLSIRKVITDAQGERLADNATPDIARLAEMIPTWPSIVNGGARYLHSVRSFFLRQYNLIKLMGPVDSVITVNLQRHTDNDLKSRLLYQRGVIVADSGEPAHSHGLISHPDFELTIMSVDQDNPCLSAESTQSVFGRNQIRQSWVNAIAEWGRLNPLSITRLFHDVRNSHLPVTSKWLEYPMAYDRLRMINARIFNIDDTVATIESVIMARQENTYQQQLTSFSGKVKKQELRMARLHHLSTKTSHSQRVGLHTVLFDQIPGDNTARNKRWRDKKDKREARNRVHYGAEYRSYHERKKENSRQRTKNILNRLQDPQAPTPSDLRHTINRRKETTTSQRQVVLQDEPDNCPSSEPTTTNEAAPAMFEDKRSEKEIEHWRCLNNIKKSSEPARGHKRKVTLPPLTPVSTDLRNPALNKKLKHLHNSKKQM